MSLCCPARVTLAHLHPPPVSDPLAGAVPDLHHPEDFRPLGTLRAVRSPSVNGPGDSQQNPKWTEGAVEHAILQ